MPVIGQAAGSLPGNAVYRATTLQAAAAPQQEGRKQRSLSCATAVPSHWASSLHMPGCEQLANLVSLLELGVMCMRMR